MNVFGIKTLLYTLAVSKYFYVILNDERQKWIDLCHNDYMHCPICFDDTIMPCCNTFLDNISLDNNFEMEISSLFGNRKIQYVTYDQRKAVLKYLINDWNLDDLKSKCCNGKSNCENLWNNKSDEKTIKAELLRVFKAKESVAGFQVCPTNSVTRFMEVFSQQSIYEWVLLNINVEPLIVNTLRRRNFSVPELIDSCGFVTLQSNNGLPLYSFFDQSFAVRLLIARNLLVAAVKFSYGVEGFR